ncbi:MAG: metal-dependent hydrolase [Candidatus Latescibacteria bacterium]|nr:metal-dependent hydrolase [Candidatus Latescibacterota bacterium]
MAHINITFLGHASFLFETEASEKIFFDPWLDDNPVCSLNIADVKEAHVACVTHGHLDHIGDSIAICKQTGATLIGSPEIAMFANKYDVKYDVNSCPLNIGGSAKIGTVTYTQVRADHSTSMAEPDWLQTMNYSADGSVCGFVLTTDSGIVLYDSGDTGVFLDMQLISQMYGVQVAILPVGGKYTMGVREAARAISLIRPEVMIPCHYNTFPNQMADINELRRQAHDLSPHTRVVELKPGETYSYKR